MALPTNADVALKLGRDLTVEEQTRVDSLIEFALKLVAEAAWKAETWPYDLASNFPDTLRWLVAETVSRSLAGVAEGVTQMSETLGEYSYSQRFAEGAGGGGLMLSDEEVRYVRRVVYGTGRISLHLLPEEEVTP
jgi:hypothetical protein